MTNDEAKNILQNSDFYFEFWDDYGGVTLDGEFTVEELQAILQLMEYSE